jgi:hypothetical protein
VEEWGEVVVAIVLCSARGQARGEACNDSNIRLVRFATGAEVVRRCLELDVPTSWNALDSLV